VNPDGTGDSIVTPPTASVYTFGWAPVGDRFAYEDANAPGIFIIDRAKQDTAVIPGMVGALYLRWSPDGSRLLFETSGVDTASIDVVSADGSGLTAVARNVDWFAAPAWSPDGRRIVFTRPGRAPDPTMLLWVMNADGSGQTRLAVPTLAAHPQWSPDGRWIAYEDGGGVSVVPAAGGGTARGVAEPPCAPSCGSDQEYQYPRWAPNSARLAGVKRSLVFVVNADGSGLMLVDAGVDFPDPQWSPSGAWIAFKGRGTLGEPELFVMAPDGSGRRQLTTDQGADQPQWFR
jgi:Tol biopolymer transport system component